MVDDKTLDADVAIFSRILDVCDKNGEISSIATILIGKPEQIENDEWLCAYRICGLDEISDDTYQIYGIDAIQSMQNALLVADGRLRSSDVYSQGRLRLHGTIYPTKKWLAIVEYSCEVSGIPSNSVDIQVKHYEFLDNELQVEDAIAKEENHTYQNGQGQDVVWKLKRILMIREYLEVWQGAELIGFTTDQATLLSMPNDMKSAYVVQHLYTGGS